MICTYVNATYGTAESGDEERIKGPVKLYGNVWDIFSGGR